MDDEFQLVDMGLDQELENGQEPVLVTVPPLQNAISKTNLDDLASLKYDIEAGLQEIRSERISLTAERKALQKLQIQLTSKMTEHESMLHKRSQVFKTLQSKCFEVDQLKLLVKKEIEGLAKLRGQLQEEHTNFQVDRQKSSLQLEKMQKDALQLNALLEPSEKISEQSKIHQNLTETLKKLTRQTTEAGKELQKLRELRIKQEQILKESQIESELIEKNQAQIDKKVKEKKCCLLDTSKAYCCKQCETHIALEQDIESRCYQVGQGRFTEKKRGFLFKTAINLDLGVTKTETFTTGSYEISWVKCKKCSEEIGWKYLTADNNSNTGKVGKFCLARYKLSSPEERSEV